MGEFKHIKVTPSDDDEVIVVGAGAVAKPEEKPEGKPEEKSEEKPEEKPEGKPEGKPEEEPDPVSEPPATRDEEPADATGAEAQRDSRASREPDVGRATSERAKRADGGYRETTLEDLERTPLPLAQKIVIVAAVICIIGAIVYYFAFMR